MIVNFIVPGTAICFDRELPVPPRRRDTIKFLGVVYRVDQVQLIMQGSKELNNTADFYRVFMSPVQKKGE